jgi:hypothetical protein
MTNSLIPSLQEVRRLLKEASVLLLSGFALGGAPMAFLPGGLRHLLAV